jgi:chorismate dehydratase
MGRSISRISGLTGLNAAPLVWGLSEGGLAPAGSAIALRTPAESAGALAAGEADLALIPAIELRRIPGLSLVPGICIAARRRVRSVVLLARRPLARLASVSVDPASRTSRTLVRILLQRRHGVDPRLVPGTGTLESRLERHDAALLISDAALQAGAGPWEAHDLAEAWAGWTDLPFVFAVWAVREGFDPVEASRFLERARQVGLEQIPRLAAEAASRPGFPGADELHAYLRELLHYDLGAREHASLARFFDEAASLGELEADAAPEPLSAAPAAAAGLATGSPLR